MALVQGGIHAGPVIGAIAQEAVDRLDNLVEQGADLRSVIDVATGQRSRDDPAAPCGQADVQLLPGTPLLRAVFLDQPLARPAQLQPGGVNQQVDRPAARVRSGWQARSLGAASNGGVIRGRAQGDEGSNQ